MSTRYNTRNPIESTDVRDMSDNAKNFDEFSNSMSDSFTDRIGRDRQTIEGSIRKAGFQPAPFDFVTGGTLVSGDRNKAVFNPSPSGDNNWYAWQGAFPKVISSSSTPATSGGLGENAWKPVTNNVLAPTVRELIRRSYAEAGYNLVDGSFEAGGTLNSVSDVLLQESSGKAYGWAGTFPKVVAAGSPVAGFASKDLNSLSEQITEFEPSVLANGVSAIKKAGGANGIKFMTWNVWSWYTIPNYFNNDYFGTKKLSLTANIALENGVSVCSLQEVWMPRTSNDLLSRGIYKGTFNGNSGDLYVMGNANWTAHNIVSSRTGQFVATDGELRGYANSVVNVNGTQVSVYTTHMTHLGGAVLNQQMQELATLVKADTCQRIVVMGDFNVNEDAAYAPLISAGLVMINKFGEYNTNNDGGTWYLDRIFYKGFSRHDRVGVLSPHKSLGDHKPLYATLYV